MEENREISALFNLIDDPDEGIFTAVSSRIVGYGKGIIPNLENLWENTVSTEVQDRIEILIHRLHHSDLLVDFNTWISSSRQELLYGAIIAARFQYPEMNVAGLLQEVEKLRRNTWLELNSYLTSLEQVNVISSILYNYFGLKGGEITFTNPDDFLINKVMEGRRGNNMSNGILYLILCEMLDIPVKAINIPRHFVLAFFDDMEAMNQEAKPDYQKHIQFYIDSVSGQVFTHKDVDNYFKRISVPAVSSYYKPLNNKRVIQLLLEDLSKCFQTEKNMYKHQELIEMAEMLVN